jgi:hypothetical protein
MAKKESSAKITDKMVLDLKLPAYVQFVHLYLGARLKINKHIAKNTIFSMAMDSVCTGKPAILYDDTAQGYTFAELRQLGEDTLRNIFTAIIAKNDTDFYRMMGGYDVLKESGDESISDKLLRNLALQIIKTEFSGVNLRDSDIENIVSVILINEEDLRVGIEGEAGKGSYLFLKEEEPYALYKEVRAIVTRYRKLRRAEETYKGLFSLFNKLLERAAADGSYSRQTQNEGDYYKAFDGNMEFFKEFTRFVQSSDLINYLSEDELKELRAKYTHMLRENGDFEAMRHCEDCETCVFDNRKCVDIWLKKHLIRLLKGLCFIDTFRPLGSPTFEESLFSKEHPGMYVFNKT